MAAILGYADVVAGHLKDPDNRNCVFNHENAKRRLLA